MEDGKYFFYNNKLVASGKAILTADNRSFRFGDGLFETMRLTDGEIALSRYHFERLFSSLQSFRFDVPSYFTAAFLAEEIKKLAGKNEHQKLARIRLTVFRSDGSLYDFENNLPNYIIQTWTLNNSALLFNDKGLATGIYTKARKTCDDFSHIKTNNFLPYTMGALWAKENKLDDAIILNNNNRVADATIANIFLMRDGKIETPALSEGCISGVMRRFLIDCIKKEGLPFNETAITTDALAEAHELFITNAVRGINWIAQCDKQSYDNQLSEYLYNRFLRKAMTNPE
ncbi:aminotransferase class IV [Parafilimonas sp.]|uniref:aminotransferase class IV n=1 Tax=Parafilimonas sp. TaxID=1969739 RepID=UPI0039E416B2